MLLAPNELPRDAGLSSSVIDTPWPRHTPTHRAVGPVEHAADRTDGADGPVDSDDAAEAIDAEQMGQHSDNADPAPRDRTARCADRIETELDGGLVALQGA